jgi:putative phosphoserine phosphatase/1-acylglycerol-3-phosphate O-acyltransferase
MAGTAAIFDLDRTLLRGSSSPAFNEALFETGLVNRRALPGQGLLTASYAVLGETLPSMALARVASLAARGKAVAEVAEAAHLAADTLERQVAPWVRPVLEGHRDAGRALVLATTSPLDLVRPLADRLGFDRVVATRWATRVDSAGVLRYTGSLQGGFVWSVGKLTALQRWASAAKVSLAGSFAYTDSIYDLPLLLAVGHPTAVNPDYRLHLAAALRRWPVVHFDAPPGVHKLLGAELQDLLALMAPRAAFPYARFDITGTEHIPRRGPVLVAANHRSYFDPIAFSLAVFDSGRRPRTLAKKEMFEAPVIGPLMRTLGTIRVDRGGNTATAMAEAEAALRAGECVVILPQGTIPRGEAFFEPRLRGRKGVARLAAATGTKVVPMGILGTEAVWPRSSRLPNVTAVVHPPVVRVRVGPPVRGLTGTDMRADTERIMEAIADLLPAEARLPRLPTAEELARTMPP